MKNMNLQLAFALAMLGGMGVGIGLGGVLMELCAADVPESALVASRFTFLGVGSGLAGIVLVLFSVLALLAFTKSLPRQQDRPEDRRGSQSDSRPARDPAA